MAAEFEDDVVSAFNSEQAGQRRSGRTLYQKTLVLRRGALYKLDLVVKDLKSGNVGVVSQGLRAPAFPPGRLAASSLVLADYIEQLPEPPATETMFVLGDFKVRPSVSSRFPEGGVLGLYFQLYNAPIDQSTLLPSLRIHYRILNGREIVRESSEAADSPGAVYNDGRIVIVKGLPLTGLPAGTYQVEIEAEDQIKQESVRLTQRFEILPHSS